MPKYRQYICEACGQPFESCKADKNRTPRFCSIKCASVRLRKMKVCAYCGKEYYNWTREKYCCKECASAALRNVPLSDEHRRKLSEGRRNSPKCHGANLYNWKGGKDTLTERMKLHTMKRRTSQHIKPDKTYLELLLKYQRNRCFYCGQDMGAHPAIEHLTPVSRGGDNQRWNLVYSCRSCNSKKHDKTLEEFAVQTGDVMGCSNRYDGILARVYAPYMQTLNKQI